MHPALGAVGLLAGWIQERGRTFYDTARGTVQHYEEIFFPLLAYQHRDGFSILRYQNT